MKSSLLKLSLAAGLTLAAGQSAFGQALDYESLSELFGEPVTAGATGAPQRASDVPATMIIITRDDIARFPEYDIPGILRHYAGMNVTRYAVGDAQVNIRADATGYSPGLLVLVDGRLVYQDSYGFTAWSALPVNLEDIQQIEVVKGAQSALYGFNAASGVVNIITRDPQRGGYSGASAAVGEDGFLDVAATVSGPLGERFSGRVSYGRTQSDPFKPYGDVPAAVGADEEFDREFVRADGRFTITDKVNVGVEVAYSESETYEASGVYTVLRTAYEMTGYRLDLQADTDFGFLSAEGFRNDTDILYDFGPMSVSTTGLRAQDLFKIGAANTIRLSAEYRTSETDDSFPAPGQGALSYDSYAFSAMWSRSLSEAVDLTLAARFDGLEWSRDGQPDPTLYAFSQEDYSVSYEEFSYNAALVWRPEFGGAVRFLAGRGVLTPAFYDFGSTSALSFGPFSIAIMGDPTMTPSIVTNYEAAYDRGFDAFDLRAAIFYKEIEDVRGGFGSAITLLPPAAPVPTLAFGNRGDTAVFGAELTLSGEIDGGFDWQANYTFQDVEDDLAPFAVETALNYEASTPEHQFNARGGWTGERMTLDAFLNYRSGIQSPNQSTGALALTDIDEAIATSVRAGYAFTETVAVSATAQNITYGQGKATNIAFEPESRLWVELAVGF